MSAVAVEKGQLVCVMERPRHPRLWAKAASAARQAEAWLSPMSAIVEDARAVLADGARRVATDVRASLDFHHTQSVGGPMVERVLLTGPAVAVPGFADVLERELGLPVESRVLASEADAGVERLSIAAGLAVEELVA